MFSATKKLNLPSAAEALPGRADKMFVPGQHAVNGAPLEPPFPAGLEQAVFGLGCFWGAERKFWQLPGVFTTAAGYAGGATPNPTYKEVCSGQTGHTEVVLVVFNPSKVTYEQLLTIAERIRTEERERIQLPGQQNRMAMAESVEAERAALA